MLLDSWMSLEPLGATSIKIFVQQVLTVDHVGVNMNLTKRRPMLNNMKKVQIIGTLALKWKVKQGDNVSKGGNH